MADIGLKYPVAAVVEEYPNGEIPTCTGGFVIGKAITAEKEIKFSSNILYADDTEAESDYSYESGTLKLSVDNILPEIQAKMFGHAYVVDDNGKKTLTKGSGDTPPYLAVGYYKTKIVRNVKSWETTILYKVKFAPPKESAKTKEKSISWGTYETEGEIKCLEGVGRDVYEETSEFSSEAEAKAYLKDFFGIDTEAASK